MNLKGAKWKKSTYSGGESGNCVELALPADRVVVRDSKNPDGPVLAFGAEVAAAFLAAVKGGRFNG